MTTEELQNVFGGPRLGKTEKIVPGQTANFGNYRWPVETDAGHPLMVSLTRNDDVNGETATVGFIDADIFGRIQYGAGGTAEEVEVDWLNGTVLAIPGIWANIIAVYPASADLIPPVTPEPWVVACGCMVGLGYRSAAGSAGQARRTFRTGPVAAAGTRAIPIPSRALDVTFLASDPAALPVTFLTFDTLPVTPAGVSKGGGRVGVALAIVQAGPAPAGPSPRILIPNGAKSIVVLNQAADFRSYSAIFTVAL